MEKYKKYFDLSLDLMCIANAAGRFIEVNRVFTDCLGYSLDDLLTVDFFNLIHPEDIASTTAEISKLNAGAITKNFENRYKHADGRYRVLSWSASIDKESGFIFAMAREVTDIVTERNRLFQIEAALESKTIIGETDRHGRITFVNDEFCKISGYSRSELIGNTHRVINSGCHSKEFFSDLWRTISSGTVWSGLIQNRKKNGELYYVQTLIVPLFDILGAISGYLSMRQDLTDSIRHEAAFARTLNILNETSAIARVGGWELDIASGELNWTDETFNILEVERNGNRNPMLPEGLQLFTPEHQPIVQQAVTRASTLGEPYSLEVQALTARGNVKWVYTNGKANYAGDKIVSISGTIQDIQARKVAETKLLEERQKSLHAAKMSSLGELAASMAHEINNPLGIISGYTDVLLESGAVTGDRVRMLQSIQKACVRIEHIVQSLRKYSRTDRDKQFANYRVMTILDEAIELARPRLKNESVQLVLKNSLEGDTYCNSIEIEQVFLNLINNSIDAVSKLPEKWIAIETSTDGDRFHVAITDSGRGIPKDMQYRIFEPFFTTKSVDKGTGLGLSIISGILKEHHADIEYLLNDGHTCFKLTFRTV